MLNPGNVLQNRYQIIQRIGGGGMGDVYLAADLRLGNNQVVVKENRGGDPQLFYAEAAILAALRHPNLPRVIDHWIEQPSAAQYLVMDYIAGQNLEQIVQARGALPERDVLAWMAQILDAVKYLHANRIIHRDIKPQNIIITPQGSAVLVDFGIAKVMQPGQATRVGAHGVGSPGYAPPEQYTGGTDERTDVYALGATLYFALTAIEPIPAPERAYGILMSPIRQRNQNVSAKVESATMKAMALNGIQRHLSITDFELALGYPVKPESVRVGPYKPLQVAKGRYRIVRLLTQDGSGCDYLVEDILSPAKQYVLRQLDWEEFGIQKAQSEVAQLAQLNYPGLPRIFDFFRDGNRYCVLMEYVDGVTLEELLGKTSKFLPLAQVKAWVGTLCDTLVYMYTISPRTLHWGIEPGNIKVTPDGGVKFCDYGGWGRWKIEDRLRRVDDVLFPRNNYWPIECYGFGGSCDVRSDLYALGATLYQLVTNTLPPEAPDRVMDYEHMVAPSKINPAVSAALDAVILQATAINPADRFQSPQEFKNALSQV